MVTLLKSINGFVWGIPTLLLILCCGLFLSIKTGFFQLTRFPQSLRHFLSKLHPSQHTDNGVSPYQALCTALAATVGTGNIAGVAGAITLGGPGAVFWMWICAFLGMILKCAEATLAVHFRKRNSLGEYIGGPMYIIEHGLGPKWKWLAVIYAFFGVVAAFGVGNATQVNALLGGIHSAVAVFGAEVIPAVDYGIAAVLAVLVAFIMSGGGKRIGAIAERLVPFASLIYLLLGVGVLIVRRQAVPSALQAIVTGAFSPQAVTGGVIGSFFMSCRIGASRGIFTNEAGMGTASIAHAAAQVKHPVEQGMMGIMEVFLDTIVICSVTALVILCSGIEIPYGLDSGSELTSAAFSQIYGGWVAVLIAASLILFALATILGWGYYGMRCAQYLFGDRAFGLFVLLQAATVILGAVLNTGTVWLLADTFNGLMAIPNLIALLALSPEFVNLILDFQRYIGGTYENIYQCKPLRTVAYAEIPSAGSSGTK